MGRDRDIERFLAKIEKSESGCWNWTAGKKGGGYGAFYLDGKLRGAHRAALNLFKALDLDTPLDAMHSCDNPGCVNPDHISYGSRVENMIDASIKGRIVRVQDWRGQLNPKSKLSPQQIAEIIAAVNAGVSRKDAAERFGISDVRVSQILKDAGFSSELSATEAASAARTARTHCKKGHPLFGENLRINSNNARVCIQCEQLNRVARRAKLPPP
jgi:hypothetical protein